MTDRSQFRAQHKSRSQIPDRNLDTPRRGPPDTISRANPVVAQQQDDKLRSQQIQIFYERGVVYEFFVFYTVID